MSITRWIAGEDFRVLVQEPSCRGGEDLIVVMPWNRLLMCASSSLMWLWKR